MATKTPPVDAPTADAPSITPRGWLRQVRAFTERSLREVRNSWTMLLTVVAFPAGLQLFYGYQWDGAPETLLASTAIGTGVFGAMYICLYIFGYQLAGDLEHQRYRAYRSMPVSPSADLVGRMCSGLLLATVAFILTLAAGVLTGATFGLQSMASVPIVIGAFTLTCLIWMVFALPFIVYAKNERVAEYAVPLLALFGYMFTGLNGTDTSFSPIDGEVLNYLPNTLPTRLLMYHLVPEASWEESGAVPPELPTGIEFLAVLGGYGVVALLVGTLIVTSVLYGGRSQ